VLREPDAQVATAAAHVKLADGEPIERRGPRFEAPRFGHGPSEAVTSVGESEACNWERRSKASSSSRSGKTRRAHAGVGKTANHRRRQALVDHPAGEVEGKEARLVGVESVIPGMGAGELRQKVGIAPAVEEDEGAAGP